MPDVTLPQYGWTDALAEAFAELSREEPEARPARVVRQTRLGYFVVAADGEHRARLSGPLTRARGADRPAVGDWVAVVQKDREDRLAVRALVPRKSVFLRKVAGAVTREQVVAANVDFVFLVSGLDHDFNPRRIERYVTLAWDSGATPVVLLNKVDLCPDPAACVAAAQQVALGVDVHSLSAQTGEGVAVIRGYLPVGVTGAFLGSSGVGKSTLVNQLAGAEIMRTHEVREDDSKGRHTTSHRQLFRLEEGGLVIDTPGMREIQLWAEEDSLEETFTDIVEVAVDCRFRDCRHEQEPGCAVRQALQEGRIRADRMASYRSLRAELERLAERQTEAGRREDRRRGKRFGKLVREVQRHHPKYK